MHPEQVAPWSEAKIFISKQVLEVINPVNKALLNAVRGIAQDVNDPPNLSYMKDTCCDPSLLQRNKPQRVEFAVDVLKKHHAEDSEQIRMFKSICVKLAVEWVEVDILKARERTVRDHSFRAIFQSGPSGRNAQEFLFSPAWTEHHDRMVRDAMNVINFSENCVADNAAGREGDAVCDGLDAGAAIGPRHPSGARVGGGPGSAHDNSAGVVAVREGSGDNEGRGARVGGREDGGECGGRGRRGSRGRGRRGSSRGGPTLPVSAVEGDIQTDGGNVGAARAGGGGGGGGGNRPFPASQNDYSTLGAAKLRDICQARNISRSGTKPALIKRLQDTDAGRQVQPSRMRRIRKGTTRDVQDEDSNLEALVPPPRKRKRPEDGDGRAAQGYLPLTPPDDDPSCFERAAAQDSDCGSDCSSGAAEVVAAVVVVGSRGDDEGGVVMNQYNWDDRVEVLRNFPDGNLDKPNPPVSISLAIPLDHDQAPDFGRGLKAGRLLELDLTTPACDSSLRFNKRDYGFSYDLFLTPINVRPLALLSTPCAKQGHRCLMISAGMGAGIHPFVLECFLQHHGREILAMLLDVERIAGPYDDSVRDIIQHLLQFNDFPDLAIFSFIYPVEFNLFRFFCTYVFFCRHNLFPILSSFVLLLPRSRQTGAGSLRLSYLLAASTVARFRCACQRCFHSSS